MGTQRWSRRWSSRRTPENQQNSQGRTWGVGWGGGCHLVTIAALGPSLGEKELGPSAPSLFSLLLHWVTRTSVTNYTRSGWLSALPEVLRGQPSCWQDLLHKRRRGKEDNTPSLRHLTQFSQVRDEKPWSPRPSDPLAEEPKWAQNPKIQGDLQASWCLVRGL